MMLRSLLLVNILVISFGDILAFSSTFVSFALRRSEFFDLISSEHHSILFYAVEKDAPSLPSWLKLTQSDDQSDAVLHGHPLSADCARQQLDSSLQIEVFAKNRNLHTTKSALQNISISQSTGMAKGYDIEITVNDMTMWQFLRDEETKMNVMNTIAMALSSQVDVELLQVEKCENVEHNKICFRLRLRVDGRAALIQNRMKEACNQSTGGGATVTSNFTLDWCQPVIRRRQECPVSVAEGHLPVEELTAVASSFRHYSEGRVRSYPLELIFCLLIPFATLVLIIAAMGSLMFGFRMGRKRNLHLTARDDNYEMVRRAADNLRHLSEERDTALSTRSPDRESLITPNSPISPPPPPYSPRRSNISY